MLKDQILEALPNMTTSQITNDLLGIRASKQNLTRQVQELEELYKVLEETLIAKLNQEGSIGTKTTLGSATLTEQDIPIIENQGAFNEYVIANHALYLFQNRLSSRACLELHNQGELPPGLAILKKPKIVLRSV